jgi:hypothetical protein
MAPGASFVEMIFFMWAIVTGNLAHTMRARRALNDRVRDSELNVERWMLSVGRFLLK